MEQVNLNVDRDLAERVKRIAQNKFSIRKIKFYSEAIHEALIEFVKKNKKYDKESNQEKKAIEASI